MFPRVGSIAWLLIGAGTITPSGPADLPLLHRDGDPRPAVAAQVAGRDTVVVVDPFGPSRIGRLAAIRLGLSPDGAGVRFDAELGPIRLDDVRAEVVDGEDVVVGLGTVSELLVSIDQQSGRLRIHRPSDPIDEGTRPVSLPRDGAHRVWNDVPWGAPRADLGAPTSRVASEATWQAGRYGAEVIGPDPRKPVPAPHGEEAVLGADAFATVSLHCDPSAAACRADPLVRPWSTQAPSVTNARVAAHDAAEAKAALWTVPTPAPDATSVPAGDPGQSWQADRWAALSDAAWARGDEARALQTAAIATDAGRDRCGPWILLGERVLRATPVGDADPLPFFERAWQHVRWFEDQAEGYTLRQDEDCRRAAGLADEARLRGPVALADLQTPLGRAVWLADHGDYGSADAALRRALADGVPATVELLAVHSWIQAELDRPLPAWGSLERLAHDPEADSLWVADVACGVAHRLEGKAGLERLLAIAVVPSWQAAIARIQGSPRPTAPLSLEAGQTPDERLAQQVAFRLARSPGDATSWALAQWLGEDAPEGPTTLDDAVLAAWSNPDDTGALAGWPLHRRVWNQAHVDPPTPPVRTPEQTHDEQPQRNASAPDETSTRTPVPDPVPEPLPEESSMIPALVVATTVAAAADFDHDHADFATFLDGAVSHAGVDYGALAARRATLETYLKAVAEVDASSFDNSQKLALYVNAYNAYTLQTMLDAGSGVSILDLDGGKVWDNRTFRVAGQDLTLNQMEHSNARKLADGRVHAVVNCASKGCPPLPPKPLTSVGIDGQLTAAAKHWADVNAYALDGNTVALSKIFDWYGDDFTSVKAERDLANVEGKEEQALWFLSRYVDDATKAKLLSGELTATWAEYDWSRNAR